MAVRVYPQEDIMSIVNLTPPKIIAEINITIDLTASDNPDIESNFLSGVGWVLERLQNTSGNILDYSVHVDRDVDDDSGEVTWIDLKGGESVE